MPETKQQFRQRPCAQSGSRPLTNLLVHVEVPQTRHLGRSLRRRGRLLLLAAYRRLNGTSIGLQWRYGLGLGQFAATMRLCRRLLYPSPQLRRLVPVRRHLLFSDARSLRVLPLNELQFGGVSQCYARLLGTNRGGSIRCHLPFSSECTIVTI